MQTSKERSIGRTADVARMSPSIRATSLRTPSSLVVSAPCRTRIVTSSPSATRRRTTRDPMKPVAPVTRTSMVSNAPVVRDVVRERIETRASRWLVGVRAAVRNDCERVGHPLEAIPEVRWYLDERVVVGPKEDLHQLALCCRFGAFVIQNELDAAVDARVVERHLPVTVPALDHVAVDGREVDLSEFDKVGIGPREHVQDRPPLVGNPLERHDVDTVDHASSTLGR